MFELITKEREIFILKKRFVFKQKTLRECIEFHFELSQDWFDLWKWCFEFLKAHNNQFKKSDWEKLDHEKTIDFILQKVFTWYFAEWKESKWNKKTAMPYGAYISACCDNDITKADRLLDMTPEAINFLLDWKIYNINEQSDKGKRKNRINQNIKNTSDAERQAILDNAAYYDKVKNNRK